jgi:hypothetical protein
MEPENKEPESVQFVINSVMVTADTVEPDIEISEEV